MPPQHLAFEITDVDRQVEGLRAGKHVAEGHDLDEAILGEPPALFHHVIEHHGDLRHWTADIDETEKEKIKKHFAPRRHLMIRGTIVLLSMRSRHRRCKNA